MASSFSSFPSFPPPGGSGPRIRQLAQQATTLFHAGRWGEAIPLLEELIRIEPANAAAHKTLASCLLNIGRLPAARASLTRAIALDPQDPKCHNILAYSWKREAAWEKALPAIDAAIRLAPGDATFVATKAEILHLAGRLDEALQTIAPVLDRAAAVPAVAGAFAAIALRAKRQSEAIPHLKAVLARTDLPPNGRTKYTFDLAALYDSVGDYEAAWPLYAAANALKNERWDASTHSATVDTVIAAWTRASIRAIPRSPIDGSPYVFIVGMPRSGTSLVEQIISTSPRVYAAGERNELLRVAAMTSRSQGMGIPVAATPAPLVNAAAVRDAAEAYAKPIRALAPDAAIITDKMPPNFLNLGLVQALLPGARVIHCRRKAMDACLSCYFQLFGGALPFAYDLAACGRFYVDYERVMQHWHEVLDLPILDVPYESVVADQEGWTRRIFEFIGLPYSDDALRFYESDRTTLTASSQQVREPIYARSVARWKHYDRHLDPLRQALGPFGER